MRYLSIIAVLSACSGNGDGFAVNLTVIVDQTVDVSAISALILDVGGAEQFTSKPIAAAGKFKNRRAGIRYKPGTSTGNLDFHLEAFDSAVTEIGSGETDGVTLKPGTTATATITLSALVPGDGGIDGSTDLPVRMDLSSSDLTLCGNGVIDPGEACDPGPGSTTPCPSSANDCDDNNPCTTDSLSGSGCDATCSHVNVADNSACTPPGAGLTGVCLSGLCCTGCVSNGVCKSGDSDAKLCGKLGANCFDCTTNSASATCNSGTCSGCDATSCTNESRTCGTSSCGFNCGTCPDTCLNGAIYHFACIKTCQQNGFDGCPAPGNATAGCSGNACSWSCNSGFKPCNGGCIPTSSCCGSADCSSSPVGPICRSGTPDFCGCNTWNDCPPYQACSASFTCGTSGCDSTHPCKLGCCNPNTGQCVSGTDPNMCGSNGGLCAVNCTAMGFDCCPGTGCHFGC